MRISNRRSAAARWEDANHKLMVNHSHSWLLPCGLPGMFWTFEFSRPPCITDAMVVTPAVLDMLAALARVTGACVTLGVDCPTSCISDSGLGPALLGAGMVLTDARDCLL